MRKRFAAIPVALIVICALAFGTMSIASAHGSSVESHKIPDAWCSIAFSNWYNGGRTPAEYAVAVACMQQATNGAVTTTPVNNPFTYGPGSAFGYGHNPGGFVPGYGYGYGHGYGYNSGVSGIGCQVGYGFVEIGSGGVGTTFTCDLGTPNVISASCLAGLVLTKTAVPPNTQWTCEV